MPETREGRLLLSIVVLLFGIQLTLVGGGPAGVVLGVVALVLALTVPASKP